MVSRNGRDNQAITRDHSFGRPRCLREQFRASRNSGGQVRHTRHELSSRAMVQPHAVAWLDSRVETRYPPQSCFGPTGHIVASARTPSQRLSRHTTVALPVAGPTSCQINSPTIDNTTNPR